MWNRENKEEERNIKAGYPVTPLLVFIKLKEPSPRSSSYTLCDASEKPDAERKYNINKSILLSARAS